MQNRSRYTVHAHKNRTADDAVGRWPGILCALGVDARYLRNRHGPCPVCAGTDRYRFDDKDGRGTWFCSHCGSGDGFALLHRFFGWTFGHAAREVDRVIGVVAAGPAPITRSDDSKIEALRAVWKSSKAISQGDPAWLYLNRRTGIRKAPADLRFHPGLKHSDGGLHPAMVALMRYPDGRPVSIHRTYLTLEGNKAAVGDPKKFMQGMPLATASVRLGEAARCMGIAEGIETALAASRRFGVPVCAATNAVLLESWVPPAGVSEVLIAGDNDASYTGQSAAFALAKRLVREGYTVEVQIPGAVGKDWADERP
jgi:putative DNA primase/helicase